MDGSTQNGAHSRSHQPIVSGSPTGPTVRRAPPGSVSVVLTICVILPAKPIHPAPTCE